MINEAKLNELIGRVLGDLGGAMSIAVVRMGDSLGLYKALHVNGPLTPEALAVATGTSERYVREWLASQAAAAYVAYDKEAGTFSIPPEQAMVFADEDSPVFMMGAFDAAAAMVESQAKVQAAFRTGGGVQWGDQASCCFCATARFFRPGYRANLVDKWLPMLDGVVSKLSAGGTVADVGCGHGLSTIMMARAFPKSQFIGFDFHEGSIAAARAHAKAHAVANVRFEVAKAKEFPGSGYDLVTFFDCLHDMGDPAGAAVHVRQALKPDGSWMIVEPQAHDRLEDNLNPVGRLYYSASTMICVPTSLSQEVGAALGAQAGEAKLHDVIAKGGFTHIRRATETPFNMILEARP
jgi:2-polyprenyl-3-methyl-5-hydroxy-6-metoxy-1,4-benzoquinol methylase